jgi:DNA-binding transcriptional LysR family regulator
MNLQNVDLNLLKVLHALIEERSVTRAGDKVGRSQPAISNALKRLRYMFDDPLLVHGAGGFQLTPRAEALKDPINAILSSIEDCLITDADTDPLTAHGLYRFSAPDYISLPVLPKLMEHLSTAAPNIDLQVLTEDRDLALEALNSNRVDIALGNFGETRKSIRIQRLFQEDFVCLVRKGHPVLDGAFTTEAMLAYPHLLVSSSGRRRGIFDDILAEQQKQRRIEFSVTHFLLAPYLLESSDMIGVFTRRVSETLRQAFRLEEVEIPFEFAKFQASMAWHLRADRDPTMRWLRAQVAKICEEFTTPNGGG